MHLALHCVVPVDTVTQAVDAIAAKFRGRTVGVHVQRGDFAGRLESQPSSCQHGPVLHVDKWRGTIFLATDGGDEVIGRFRDLYGDRLLIYPRRCPGRDTPQAVAGRALVDVYLLQRCQAIIGTRYSSFSELAWCITKTPYAKVSSAEVDFLAKLKFSSRLILSRFRRI